VGLMPGSASFAVQSFGAGSVSPATLPWASGWTLQILVSSAPGTTASGDLFTIEIID
jgi:hypothetical protein